MKQHQSQIEMLLLSRDGDWNVARDVGMTTERLVMRLSKRKLLAKKQHPSKHHDWRIASSAPPGNCRLLARHRLRGTDSQTSLQSLAEATPAGDGRAPAVAVCALKALIVQAMVQRLKA